MRVRIMHGACGGPAFKVDHREVITGTGFTRCFRLDGTAYESWDNLRCETCHADLGMDAELKPEFQ